LNALTPLFTLLIGILFFAQRTTWGKGLGFFLGLLGSIGITLISSPSGKLEFNSYTLLVLTASLFYGINGNMTKHYLAGIKPLALTSLSLTLVAPFALGVLLLSDIQTNYQQHDNSFWALLSLIALGMSSTAIAMILFNYLIQMTSAVFASSVTYLIPLVAIGWGLWDGEMLTWLHLACMATIVGGVYLANRQAK
jgi:drug/metabolite transporter (DMT)-like permease